MRPSWWTDFARARRSLGRAPATTGFVITVIAVAVAATLAVLSVADAVLWRGLGVPDPRSLVRIYSADEAKSDLWPSASYPVFADYRDGVRSLSAIAAYQDEMPVHLRRATGQATPVVAERATAGLASGQFFEVLGTRPRVGRLLEPADDMPGAAPVAVLSDRYWRVAHQGSVEVLGSEFLVNGQAFRVVGVLPEGFVGAELSASPDLWLPMVHVASALPAWASWRPLENRGFSWLQMVGRLAPGVSMPHAQAELDAFTAARAVGQAVDPDPRAALLPAAAVALGLEGAGEQRRLAWFLAAGVLTLLAAAAANASGVLLAHGERRVREIAVSRALGASTARLVWPLALEGILLALVGVALGVVLAPLCLAAFRHLAAGVPLPLWAATDLHTVRAGLGALAVFVVVALGASLLPVLRWSRRSVVDGLTASGRTTTARRRLELRELLVVTQVASGVALVLLVGMFWRTLASLRAIDPGFEANGVAAGQFDLALEGYDRTRGLGFVDRLLGDLEARPGVAAAAVGSNVPITPSGMRMTPRAEGYEPGADEDLGVHFYTVSQRYFETLGVPVLAGREFAPSDHESAASVAHEVIVNRDFVERYWPGIAMAEAVGRRVLDVGIEGGDGRVVGVVDSFKQRRLREGPEPALFLALGDFWRGRLTVVARGTPGMIPEPALARLLERTVAEIDPGLPVSGAVSLRQQMDNTLAPERALLALFAIFAAVVVGLVVAGVYGVLALSVAKRRREIGVRQAIGAAPRDVVRLVVGRGLGLAVGGMVLGVVAGVAAARTVERLFFGVAALDPAVLVQTLGSVLLIVLLGAWIPARRAVAVDPATVLREDA